MGWRDGILLGCGRDSGGSIGDEQAAAADPCCEEAVVGVGVDGKPILEVGRAGGRMREGCSRAVMAGRRSWHSNSGSIE